MVISRRPHSHCEQEMVNRVTIPQHQVVTRHYAQIVMRKHTQVKPVWRVSVRRGGRRTGRERKHSSGASSFASLRYVAGVKSSVSRRLRSTTQIQDHVRMSELCSNIREIVQGTISIVQTCRLYLRALAEPRPLAREGPACALLGVPASALLAAAEDGPATAAAAFCRLADGLVVLDVPEVDLGVFWTAPVFAVASGAYNSSADELRDGVRIRFTSGHHGLLTTAHVGGEILVEDLPTRYTNTNGPPH
ncbi:hypothetical protein C8Q73DRAFT_661526 [Cubamyces lactineus]|nr:hypothetical protein C8Q73DRAFT_661526 [Cubamyces lactineus]